jgi:hypothetical protein
VLYRRNGKHRSLKASSKNQTLTFNIKEIEKMKNNDTRKHTDGPWYPVTIDASYSWVIESELVEIARLSEWPDHKAEAEANARLIAAGPVLLEACMLALAAIKSECPFEHGNPTIGRAWGSLESAIEKATSNI